MTDRKTKTIRRLMKQDGGLTKLKRKPKEVVHKRPWGMKKMPTMPTFPCEPSVVQADWYADMEDDNGFDCYP